LVPCVSAAPKASNFCNETRSKRIKYIIEGVEMLSKALTVLVENDAVDDYIRVAELPETDAIRKRGELHHKVVTEKYIILSDRKNSYLAVFRQRCRELDELDVTPDIRHDLNTVRARFDTYRGCRIQALYEITEGQVQELLNLGDKSGK